MFGMKFCIVDQAHDKLKAFERLIAAAGGEVVSSMNDANVIIKDEVKSKTAVPDGVRVENPLFLNSLILTLPQSL